MWQELARPSISAFQSLDTRRGCVPVRLASNVCGVEMNDAGGGGRYEMVPWSAQILGATIGAI